MSLVSAAKPAVGGGVYVAPEGTTLPTTALASKNSAFAAVGAISDAGVTRSINKETTVVKAWGGNVVAVLSNGKTETVKFKMIDVDNLSALGLVFENASGTLSNGISIQSKAGQETPHAIVIDTILADNVAQRLAIPHGVVTAIGDIVYVDNAVIGFDVTITAIEDSSGVTVYEYMQTVPANSGSGSGT